MILQTTVNKLTVPTFKELLALHIHCYDTSIWFGWWLDQAVTNHYFLLCFLFWIDRTFEMDQKQREKRERGNRTRAAAVRGKRCRLNHYFQYRLSCRFPLLIFISCKKHQFLCITLFWKSNICTKKLSKNQNQSKFLPSNVLFAATRRTKPSHPAVFSLLKWLFNHQNCFSLIFYRSTN